MLWKAEELMLVLLALSKEVGAVQLVELANATVAREKWLVQLAQIWLEEPLALAKAEAVVPQELLESASLVLGVGRAMISLRQEAVQELTWLELAVELVSTLQAEEAVRQEELVMNELVAVVLEQMVWGRLGLAEGVGPVVVLESQEWDD